ncbi:MULTISPECIES: terminase small subunit [unclassified Photorhabdus]|uniref:terminase small subunit n=1 Tax=unclassified Photorhabdus TaxID=2620880 RepID=UPI000DCBF484|nr:MULTISPECIES: terminase small subunit [unclassified Photorhabdus]RAW93849.1 terminase small subunit [Photorhabdus sp. S9-53]RAW97250.1 terminase small subunit [Photorhabdus sp. S8-52]RAW97613.1 terminase small subunit [Photorhabdus sp. S10-54]
MAQKKVTLTDEQKILFDALTPLQQKFVTHILKGKNLTDAYKLSGGKAKGESAHTQASRMMSFDKVKAFLDAMNAEAISDAVMSRQEALERLSAMGRVSIYNIAEFRNCQIGEDEDGKPVFQASWQFKDSALQDPAALSAISELTTGKDGIKLKLHDPKAAIKQLSELQGWEAPKKTEVTGAGGGPIQIADLTDEQLDERLKEFGYGRRSSQLDEKLTDS